MSPLGDFCHSQRGPVSAGLTFLAAFLSGSLLLEQCMQPNDWPSFPIFCIKCGTSLTLDGLWPPRSICILMLVLDSCFLWHLGICPCWEALPSTKLFVGYKLSTPVILACAWAGVAGQGYRLHMSTALHTCSHIQALCKYCVFPCFCCKV
jgi:hypothetical protein